MRGNALARLRALPAYPVTQGANAAGSGSHGYPYDAVPTTPSFPGAPTIHLSHYGDVQREFTMSGKTNICQQSGMWGPGRSVERVGGAEPHPLHHPAARALPGEPGEVHGTVVVEWPNDPTGGDQDPVWSEICHEVLSEGYAYVGVSAQTGSMVEDKTWDAERYGTLGDSSDGQSYDIFSQAAEVARADAGRPLGGLHPTTVTGMGDSQSAFRLVTYVNAIQPLSHAFNGLIAIGRSALAAPITNGLVAFSPSPGPRTSTCTRASTRRPRSCGRTRS
jgi:Alpha/beta hydrolase domain